MTAQVWTIDPPTPDTPGICLARLTPGDLARGYVVRVASHRGEYAGTYYLHDHATGTGWSGRLAPEHVNTPTRRKRAACIIADAYHTQDSWTLDSMEATR